MRHGDVAAAEPRLVTPRVCRVSATWRPGATQASASCPSFRIDTTVRSSASLADMGLIAGLLVEKFQWCPPLHRQHQRVFQAGFQPRRP